MKPREFLARAARKWFRRYPAAWQSKFARDHLRILCTRDDLLTWTTEGFMMYASPHEYISHRVFFFGNYDPVMSSFIKAHVPQGGVCWDIGAERGWFSLLMGHLVGRDGRVDAFEAFPPTYEKLQRNIALNNLTWVHAHNLAICDDVAIKWFVPPDKVQHGVSFLKDSGGIGYLVDEFMEGSIKVNTTSLDAHSAATGITRLDLIKLDIEGAEIAALRGGCQTITRFRPTILIEYNRAALQKANGSVEELDDLLDTYGYDRYKFDGRLTKLMKEDWAEGWNQRADHEAVMNVFCLSHR